MIYFPSLCVCLVTNDITTQCDVKRSISTSKWWQRVSICFVFSSRTLVPRSTLVYRWSRLKEESPDIFLKARLNEHLVRLATCARPTQRQQGKPLLG